MSRQIGIHASKLLFKGDVDPQKKKKKKKRKSSVSPDNRPAKSLKESTSEAGWSILTSLDQFEGPCLILFPETEPPSILTHPLETENIAFHANDMEVQSFEPTHVQQVFVARKILGSANEPRWALRTAEGRYLSADTSGLVSCSKEAIGATEEWLPIYDSATCRVSFQSITNHFLQIDQPNLSKSAWNVRCDSSEIGFCHRFCIKVQTSNLRKGPQRQQGDPSKTELEMMKQSWGGKKIKAEDDPSALRKAAHHGKVSEYYLDRREKMKSDRYCK